MSTPKIIELEEQIFSIQSNPYLAANVHDEDPLWFALQMAASYNWELKTKLKKMKALEDNSTCTIKQDNNSISSSSRLLTS